MRAILVGSLLTMLLVPALPQPAPSGLDPAGKWTFDTKDEDGNAVAGTMEIKGTPGNYSGEIAVNGMDQRLPITDVATSANAFIVIATVEDGAAVIKISKGADGKLQSLWGPVKKIIPATIERAAKLQ